MILLSMIGIVLFVAVRWSSASPARGSRPREA
jgi:hypothetical protein